MWQIFLSSSGLMSTRTKSGALSLSFNATICGRTSPVMSRAVFSAFVRKCLPVVTAHSGAFSKTAICANTMGSVIAVPAASSAYYVCFSPAPFAHCRCSFHHKSLPLLIIDSGNSALVIRCCFYCDDISTIMSPRRKTVPSFLVTCPSTRSSVSSRTQFM